MKRVIIFSLFILTLFSISQPTVARQKLPTVIASGPFKSGHIQGIAYDRKSGHLYLSYTTMLIKCDLDGNILGSVVGLVGHLGDLTFNEKDGRVYGSLEYKDDVIGRSLLAQGKTHTKSNIPNAFYIAIFDGRKINREGILPGEDNILTTVHLGRVLDDYESSVEGPKLKIRHRLGCSGIDGVSLGPKFGKSGGKQYLTVAYGIYSDPARKDNDYQILHQYDISNWKRYEQPLTQSSKMHQSGPDTPDGEYFAYTGNTSYGVQNLEYDKEQKVWWMAVYPGRKPEFPNYPLFAIDGKQKPEVGPLKGVSYIDKCSIVSLQERIPSLSDPTSGTRGWAFGGGSTGFYPVGNGYYYISHNYATQEGEGSYIRLYRFVGQADKPFERVKDESR